jgi:integrase
MEHREPLTVDEIAVGAAPGDAGGPEPDDAELPVPFSDELSEAELAYARAARAENTQRGYRSDWADFRAWAATEAGGPATLPAAPETVTAYVLRLAGSGAKVATIGRRLSSIAYAHRMAGHPSPTDHPRVQVVWAGVRRHHAAAVDHAPPLMPPVLWDVVEALPATPAGWRDAAILLVGFVGALRRSELAAAQVADLTDHTRGRVLQLPVSKTDQLRSGQLVVLPRSGRPGRCPVVALDRWLDHAAISDGPLFRGINRHGTVGARALTPAGINRVVQRACAAVLGPDHGYSAHSLRAGFATYAATRGSSDRAIAHQTRHKSLASVAVYIRHDSAWIDNAATNLDL